MKPRSGISSVSVVGVATSTSSRFLPSISLLTGLCRKPKLPWAINPYYPDEGDSIWCVFDRDDNSNEVLLRAKQSATKEGYRLAYSNPSFELWFLLHFSNQQTEVEDCQALISKVDSIPPWCDISNCQTPSGNLRSSLKNILW